MYGTIDPGHTYDEYLVLLAKSGMTHGNEVIKDVGVLEVKDVGVLEVDDVVMLRGWGRGQRSAPGPRLRR
jgi:hypothetical protein